MNTAIIEFSHITFIIFFLYVFLETKIYLALWAAVLYLLTVTMYIIGLNITTYKLIISVYVVTILFGYLYVLRSVFVASKKSFNNEKLRNLLADKKKKRRIGGAILILLIINVAAMFVKKN